MPRRLLGILILLLVSAPFLRAQGDAVLLRIGTDSVTRAEAEHYFHRSKETDFQTFLSKFIDYRLKLLYAKELGMDTLPDYLQQKALLTEMLVAQGKNTARHTAYTGEWVKLSHVTIPLKQQSGKDEVRKAMLVVDSLAAALKDGADWETVAEELPWMQTRHLLQEWQEQLQGLEQGQRSKPFLSPWGVHIIVWKDRRKFQYPSKEAEATGLPFRLQEANEGLLIAALEAYQPVPTFSEKELEAYFKRYRSDYGGGIPHFQGAVIHCRDKKEAKAIKKYLKAYPQELWTEAFERMQKEGAGNCRMEAGLFRIGQNPYVDKLVFKCGSFEPLAEAPYTWVLGKTLKKGPDNYRLLRGRVEADYLEYRKKAEIQALKQKYRVEINEEVLKTVNYIGNE